MSEKKLIYSHYFSSHKHDDQLLPQLFGEFKANGISTLVLTDPWMNRLLKEPFFFSTLKYAAHKQQITLREAHAPYGECFDLCSVSAARRPQMIKDHITCMRYAAELGSKTYTIHIGAWDSVVFNTPNVEIRPYALDTLEQLLPEAEKLGIIIAVENSFERSNTPDEVIYYLDHFNNHPNLGCCFDAGHANIMAGFPGKQHEKYIPNLHFAWRGKIEEYNGAFEKLAPQIVTCHLHDNNGYGDDHQLPGNGIINWQELADKLLNHAPRLVSIQSEVSTLEHAIPVRVLCEKFREIFPDWE